MNEVFISHSEKETLDFSVKLAQSLGGGEIFALSGDLGCGKTTFVKGLALGLQISKTVTSPTFNLVHRYLGGRLVLIHYDLYRLKKMFEIEALDLEIEMETKSILAIEWPDLAKPLLPMNRTQWILFEEMDHDQRKITIH